MSIPFVPDPQTTEPGIYRPHPNLIRVVAPNAGPFTYTGTGTYILCSGADCAVIDPGPASDSHLSAILEAIDGRTVTAILVTHTHRDHSPAANPLKAQTTAPIWGCAPAANSGETGEVALDESQDFDYAPDRILTDGEVVSIGSASLRIFATPGHLANHLCYFWEDEGALFSGDHIMGWATSVVIPPDGHMASYMESLERTLALGPKSIWPTHGQPVLEPAPFIKALIAHRRAREEAIYDQVCAGNGDIPKIVEALYQDVPKALHPAAAQSVFAHIIHLCEQDKVMPTNELKLLDFFRPKSNS